MESNLKTDYLKKSLGNMGIRIGEDGANDFVRFHKFLTYWNSKLNLTAVTDWEESVERHYLDSASISLGYPFEAQLNHNDVKVLDVGSGAGFPGIPLKILFPKIQLTLLDSVNKKTDFLVRVVCHLGLDLTCVETERAEILARNDTHRGAYDLVLARAVSKLNVLAELTIPFCKVGGLVIAMKGKSVGSEIATSSKAITALGGEVVDVIDCNGIHRFLKGYLVVLKKVLPTPAKFPRRPGIPLKRPLSGGRGK